MANILHYTHQSLRRFFGLWSSGVWRGGVPSDSKFDGSDMFGKFLPTFTACWCLLVFSLPQPSCRARTKRLHTTQRGALIWAIWGYRSMEIPSSWSSRNRRIEARHVWTPHIPCKALKRLIRREQVKIIPRCACYCTTPWIWMGMG